MSEKLWPVRPSPVKDQTLSSWMANVALGNGILPRKLYLHKLGWRDVWEKDIDLMDDMAKLEFLSQKTGKNIEDIKALRMADGPFLASPARNVQYPKGSTSFCPDCLENDKPYFRKKWRSSMIVICEQHEIFLCSRCQVCAEPIYILDRNKVVGLEYCGKCKESLAATSERIAAPDALKRFTRKILATLEGDWFELRSDEYVHPLLFLRGLDALIEILCTRDVWPKIYSHLSMEDFFEKPFELTFNPGDSLSNRCVFLWALSWLLDDWPNRFYWATTDCHYSPYDCEKIYGQSPYWLWAVLKKRFYTWEDRWNTDEIDTLLRMIRKGALDEETFNRINGGRFVHVNGRNLTSFRNIYKEAMSKNARKRTSKIISRPA